MRVVFPLAGLNVSGGVKNLLLQASELAEAGHDVRLLVPDYAAAVPFPISAGVSIDVLASVRRPSAQRSSRTAARKGAGGSRRVPRWIRQLVYYLRLAVTACEGADVCVVAYYPTVYCAAISRLLRRSRTRIVYSVAAYEPITHGLAAESRLPFRLLRAALAWLSYRLPTQRVYASAWLREQVGDPRGIVIGRGIDTRVFTAVDRSVRSPNQPLRIGTIGRSGRVKGYADLLEAVSGFDPAIPAELVVLALDPVALPTSLPVTCVPPQDERGMADFYRSLDIFVFASLSEGFPAPPLEAMACGCAVITTDCGGVREYALDGDNCLMVPPASPGALRAALTRLCADQPLRDRLAARGQRTAAAFDRQRMLDRFVSLVT